MERAEAVMQGGPSEGADLSRRRIAAASSRAPRRGLLASRLVGWPLRLRARERALPLRDQVAPRISAALSTRLVAPVQRLCLVLLVLPMAWAPQIAAAQSGAFPMQRAAPLTFQAPRAAPAAPPTAGLYTRPAAAPVRAGTPAESAAEPARDAVAAPPTEAPLAAPLAEAARSMMPVIPPSLPLVATLSEGPAMSAGGSGRSAEGEGPVFSPVLVELYTSQGCASCPPADEMLASISTRDDVIALALHVDYWDYIGWVDRFAMPEHSERQRRYARAHGHSTIYTPQVVVNGQDIMEGFRVVQVMESIDAHRANPRPVALEIERSVGGELRIRARRSGSGSEIGETNSYVAARSGGMAGSVAMGAVGGSLGLQMREAQPYTVDLVRYQRHAEVDITAGENAGRRAGYVNIVTSWEQVGQWDLAEPLDLTVPVEGDAPIVVLIQEPGFGAVVASQQLR